MAKPRGIKDDIIRLRAEGMTYNQIEKELNTTKSTISYWVGTGNENARAKANLSRNAIKKHIKEYKESVPCKDCGKYYEYFKLQFDHLPQFEKSFTIATFYDYTSDLEVIKAEIAKCDVVCANCHAARTHSRRIARIRAKVVLPTDEVFDEDSDYDFLHDELD